MRSPASRWGAAGRATWPRSATAWARPAHLQALLLGRAEDAPPAGLAEAAEALGPQEALVDRLSRALTPELPALARDGGFVAPGYAPQLDELKQLRDESRRLIAGLQAKYVEATGIASLKVKHNNVLGYFVEVSNANAGKMPEDGAFRHRQTLASAVRYTTVELGELEQKISAGPPTGRLRWSWRFSTGWSRRCWPAPGRSPRRRRRWPSWTSPPAWPQLAVEARWTRPQVEDSEAFRIEAGRHPVVEAALAAEAGGALRRQRLRPEPDAAAMAGHRPQHGGASPPSCARTR